MNKEAKNLSVAKLAGAALKAPPELTAARISSRLRKMTARLKSHYLKVNHHPTGHPVEEWLCDNYYVLEKESKQSIKDITHLSRRAAGDELARLYFMLESVVLTAAPNLDDETMTEIMRACGRVKHISESQFSFIPAALKAVLIRAAYRACFESRSEDEIRYAVEGLSKLTAIDFDEVVKTCSKVEEILSKDPSGVYMQMDSDSRNYYRHLVAEIAAATRQGETEVAESMQAAALNSQEGENHIGHPIVNHPAITRGRRTRGRLAITVQALLPLLACAGIWMITGHVWVALICLLPIWEVLRTPIWQLSLAGLTPDFIPRLDPKKLTNRPKSVVLVSTLLPTGGQLPALEERLCQLYYSNSDPNLFYCILADFKEWDLPSDEKDDAQVAALVKLIERLNQEHGDRFMLFLRSRTFSKTQKKYSGWERKRGAITEFIRFVKGEKTQVHTFTGDRQALREVKYIIALDADTNLLYECAQTLVCAAIHPLNRPRVNDKGVVVSGYGILAPKMSLDLHSARATAFSRVMSGCGGVTAYDTREKDFYQDLFGESIFAGKGLIDIDVFHRLLSTRLPENQILSHDILEGAYLRAGFVSDVEMTDNAPGGMVSWLSRLHRWIRGDWQNIKFISTRTRVGGKVYENPISRLNRYKLADNLRRSITPIFCLVCLTAGLFMQGNAKLILAFSGILGVTFPALWASVFSLVSGGFYTLSRKFFTRTLPHAFELLGQACFMLIMLPALSFVALDGILRALWRTYISRKKLLEWTTAAQSEGIGISGWGLFYRFWPAAVFGAVFLILALRSALSLAGIAFVLFIPTALLSGRPSREDKVRLTPAQRDTLISYNAAMWRYYEDFANEENNFLPPDNIQQSPVYRVAHRTSPTNIGMMMLSVLAARDFDFIDTDGLYSRIERTLTSLEKLATWNGNLYNWYDTKTLDTLKPEFVSSVDSGNFICSLVALVEGLREFIPGKPKMAELITRLEKIIDDCELGVFYNKKKNLFSIGYDIPTESLSGSHYDFLMSEARLTSYYAVARKIVGKKHWGALIRTMSRLGPYAGAVSWTGTTFEYYMPHLLLPVYEGSLLSEGLIYCLYCQKQRVKDRQGTPWGISESAFYAFDNNLNYQYKAHGVQKIGVKRHLDRELVISPYSTFLTISQNPNSAMTNLGRLRKLGVYGRYGFFEAVDFTRERVGSDGLAVIRNYMAHHIGMSMVSSVNALQEGKMQKRFMRDHYMKSAGEFLQEKIAKNTVVYDDIKDIQSRGERRGRGGVREELAAIYPQAPRATLLTNGELTHLLTDTGAGHLGLGEFDLTRRSSDLLRRAQGVLTLARINDVTLSATGAPFFDQKAGYTVEYDEHAVTHNAKKQGIELATRSMMHPTYPCEQRQVVVKSSGGGRHTAQLLIYFEPVLAPYQDYNAHPAFSKLFVQGRYSQQTRALIFGRKDREGRSVHLAVGFLDAREFEYETRREVMVPSPDGINGLWSFYKKEFTGGTGVPDACAAIRFDIALQQGGQGQAALLLCAGYTEAEAVSTLVTIRRQGGLDSKTAARPLLLGNTLEGRLGGGILGQLIFPQAGGRDSEAGAKNSLGQKGLWPAGISGDLPIALIETGQNEALPDEDTLASYLKLHAYLRGCKVEFDLVVLYDKPQQRATLEGLVSRHSAPSILGARGGVFLLHTEHTPGELITLLRAAARHTFSGGSGQENLMLTPFVPVELLPITPAPLPLHPELTVSGGVFAAGRFYIQKNSPLPWCHILANQSFGTLVSENTLGYTWAVNSRENKLTPWYNDIATDNTGELILLNEGGRFYNLTLGARASFSKLDALYEGSTGGVTTSVKVTIAPKGCAKYIDLNLKNRGSSPITATAAYYTEPVLGVNRDTARHIRAVEQEGALVLENPFGSLTKSYMAIGAPGQEGARFTSCRHNFLSGEWEGVQSAHPADPCAAVTVPVTLPPGESVNLRFVLSWGGCARAAVIMQTHKVSARAAVRNSLKLDIPDKGIEQFVQVFCPHQILHSRILGRTAFYQCGGAYGFRDQLQDAMSYRLIEPEVLRRQIIRCASVQFADGDVLHWWHPLPKSSGGVKGVRTRFSDDLLWLPLAVAEYIGQMGDDGLLDIRLPYLESAPLPPGVQEQYISPGRTALREDIFTHALRAIERGYNLGEGGIPLIGCGDWNDGFSAVGEKGKGRSVWMAFFLIMVMEKFAPVCRLRGLEKEALKLEEQSNFLRGVVDSLCWDGQWYIRAFFDDGEKMGASGVRECYIDLLPQSFAALAGMPDKSRVETAIASVYNRLVDEKLQIVKLFAEPFENTPQQPGYVKAYPAGIRENGGQYTHAAVWFAIALLRTGKVEEGFSLIKMLCPTERALSPTLFGQYKLEPYYIAADIYSNPAAPGRGGWSIYTGAASWYLRAVWEEVIGICISPDFVSFSPSFPAAWNHAGVSLEIKGTNIDIEFVRGITPGMSIEAKPVERVPLDGGNYKVRVEFV